jgi:hypothetical protein
VWALIIGVLVAVLGSATDYCAVETIASSPFYGGLVYKLRYVGFPGILGAAILTGLASGNFHGPTSDTPYYVIAFGMNATVYTCLAYWVLGSFFGRPLKRLD